MIKDHAHIDFEMLLQLVKKATPRIYHETEILEILNKASINPRAFIPVNLIESVTHFVTEDICKEITTKQHLNHLNHLLGPPSKHPHDDFIEVELEKGILKEMIEKWRIYEWEDLTPYDYGSTFRDYQLSDILHLRESISLNLIPEKETTDSLYDQEDRLMFFTAYQLQDAFPSLDFSNPAKETLTRRFHLNENNIKGTDKKTKKNDLRMAFLKGWLAGKGFTEPHHFEDETQATIWEKLGQIDSNLFAPSSQSLINSLFENQKTCSFKVGRRKKPTN